MHFNYTLSYNKYLASYTEVLVFYKEILRWKLVVITILQEVFTGRKAQFYLTMLSWLQSTLILWHINGIPKTD
jgi:hypothetical protein